MSFALTKKTKTNTGGSAPGTGSAAQKTATPRQKPSALQVAERPKTKVETKKPNNAPITLTIREYAGEAADVVNAWDASMKAYQIELQHDAMPHVDDRFLQAMNDSYLPAMQANNPDMPGSLLELRAMADTIVVITKTEPNPLELPLVNWRLALYVAGDLQHLIEIVKMLDDYIAWRVTHPLQGVDRSPWPALGDITVNIYPHTGIDLSGLDRTNLKMTGTVIHPPSATLPLGVFEASPPGSATNQVMVATVELVDAGRVAIEFRGRTYQFRARFDAASIPLSTAGQETVRLLTGEQGIIDSGAKTEDITNIFGNGVLRGTVCLIRLDDFPEEEDESMPHVNDFLEKLRAMKHLTFE